MKGESKPCNYFSWKKIKNNNKYIIPAEDMLKNLENEYTCACARFLDRSVLNEPVWVLSGKKDELKAMIINSKSTLLPVFCGLKEIPPPKFLVSFFKFKNIHSIQGLKEEVIILENYMKQFGRNPSVIFDYHLMKLDNIPKQTEEKKSPRGLVLRIPGMSDLDKLAPLQAGYEHEEVMHRESIFSPAASRINLSRVIAGGKILAAELDGRIAGKINVSGISFTRYLIGGVYVHPSFRGQGIARKMTEQFIISLINEERTVQKGITLFVKKTNISAIRLYSGLGFTITGDYRISYY